MALFGYEVVKFFFFNDTATTEIYTLSLHDALPISGGGTGSGKGGKGKQDEMPGLHRSEEHTSELQSQFHLVCRLLLEKKKKPARCTRSPPSVQTPSVLRPPT